MSPARPAVVLCTLLLLAGCDVDQVMFGGAGGVQVPVRHEPWLRVVQGPVIAYYRPDTIELDVAFTFTNRGRTTVAVPRCTRPHQPALDKLIGHEWVEVLAPAGACWAEPLVIGAGRTVTVDLRVVAGRWHTFIEPQFRTSRVPGIYRLRWDIYEYDALSQFRIGARLPVEYRVSNEFRIIE
jgi:hypothetical protein